MRPVKIGNKGNPFYNGSGYPDPTAFAAIKKTDRERSQKMNLKSNGEPDIMRGDIYEMEGSRGDTIAFVVVAVSRNYVSGLQLLNSPTPERCSTIKARAMMYTDPGRLTYVYTDRLGEFVRSLTEQELSDLLNDVRLALDLGAPEAEARAETTPAEAEPDEPKAAPAQSFPNVDAMVQLSADLFKATAERDVYKDLYTGLLDKVMEARA